MYSENHSAISIGHVQSFLSDKTTYISSDHVENACKVSKRSVKSVGVMLTKYIFVIWSCIRKKVEVAREQYWF